MVKVFPHIFSLSRRSRASGVYEVQGQDFDSLILRGGDMVGSFDTVLDPEGLLGGQGISVERAVDRVGPGDSGNHL